MMGFDHGRLPAKTALHHIRINSSLYQKVYGADLLRLFLEYTDKLFSDNLALLLRLRHPRQPIIESLLSIHPDEIKVI